MADPKHDDGACLDLGDEEQWVLHAALLDYLDRRADEAAGSTGHGGASPRPSLDAEAPVDGDSGAALELLDALEAEEALRLDREGLLLVRELLSEYLAGAPLRDRATCRSVLAEVRDEL